MYICLCVLCDDDLHKAINNKVRVLFECSLVIFCYMSVVWNNLIYKSEKSNMLLSFVCVCVGFFLGGGVIVS